MSFPLTPGPHLGISGYAGPHYTTRCSFSLWVCHYPGLSHTFKVRCLPFPENGRVRGRTLRVVPGLWDSVLASLRSWELGAQLCWGEECGEPAKGKVKFRDALEFNLHITLITLILNKEAWDTHKEGKRKKKQKR